MIKLVTMRLRTYIFNQRVIDLPMLKSEYTCLLITKIQNYHIIITNMIEKEIVMFKLLKETTFFLYTLL